MVEAEDRHAKKRADILSDSLAASHQPGWGYFGVPAPLAIGDNSYAPKLVKAPPPEEDSGEPLKNVTSNPLKKGAGVDVYFSFETPLALSDPYVDPHKLNGPGKVTMLDPEAAFKPPGAVKNSSNKLGYEYIAHKDTAKDPKAVREKYRDYIPPRQILSNPPKKGGGGVLTGGVLFGFGDSWFPAHMNDDYDATKKLRKKELEEHKSKLQEAPFKNNSYGNKSFADVSETFHYDVPTHRPRDKVPVDTSRRFPHEAEFKPSNPTRKGVLHGTIGGIPAYWDDPVPGGAVKKPPPEGDPPPPYKLGSSRSVTNPMPSVVTNLRNMRNERPSSFSRPRL